MKEVRNHKTLLYAIVMSAVVGVGGLLATFASQAFAEDQHPNVTNATKSHGYDHWQWIRSMIVKDVREHRDMRWTGLATDSHSLVPGVKVLGVVEKSNDTVTVTLGHMTKGNEAIDSSAVSDNITLTAVVFNSQKDPHSHLDGSVNVPSGWSGTTSVDVKLAGKDPVFDYHFIRVVAVDSAGSSQQ